MNDDFPDMQATSAHNRRLTTVVATDICGYSALSERNDSLAVTSVDRIYTLFETHVVAQGGRVFKRIADGFLAEFPSTHSAVTAVLDFTRAVKDSRTVQNTAAVRTGIHVGDVIDRDDGDLLGHGVNVAVRLQEHARINGILASQNVVDLLGSHITCERVKRGPVTLKNISKPIIAFDISDVPTSPIGRLTYRAKHMFRRPLRLGAAPVVALSLIWAGNVAVRSNLLEARLADIQERVFSDPSVSQYDNQLNAAYVGRVLVDLAESKNPSDQAVLALIETGDVEGAVASLEKSLSDIPKTDPRYLATLHQIGALTYQRDPKKAIRVYEDIVERNPDDLTAITRLGRSYDVIGNVCKARNQYEKALKYTPKESDSYIKLELDRAFNFIMGGDSERSLNILSPYIEDMRRRDADALWSLFQTEYGIALERAGKTHLSSAVLSSVVHIQQQLEDYSNLSRTYNILGFLAVRKAQENVDLNELFYREAVGHFSKQLEIDTRIGRLHTLPGAHYFLGEVHEATGNMQTAERHFSVGLTLANDYDVINFQFLNTIGLASVEQTKGNRRRSCEIMAQAQNIYDLKVDSGIGPKTKSKIELLGCGFKYKPQPAVTECGP